MAFTVAPGLLIAMPDLLDPNFAGAVVVLCAHTSEGAFGVIINQALDIPVAAICAEADIEWHGDQATMVYCGGPVEQQRGWLLHDGGARFEGSQVIDAGLGITTSQDGLAAFGKDPGGHYRLVLGYAGWGPGQLEQEITEGAWITASIDPSLVFMADRDQIWSTALRSVGVDPAHLVAAGTQLN